MAKQLFSIIMSVRVEGDKKVTEARVKQLLKKALAAGLPAATKLGEAWTMLKVTFDLADVIERAG